MAALSESTNVYNTALLVLMKKGYQAWLDEESELYCAEKDGWDFMSDSPCGLLGLVAIFEFKQPKAFKDYWWREEGPDIYRDPPEKPRRPYRPVWKKK